LFSSSESGYNSSGGFRGFGSLIYSISSPYTKRFSGPIGKNGACVILTPYPMYIESKPFVLLTVYHPGQFIFFNSTTP